MNNKEIDELEFRGKDLETDEWCFGIPIKRLSDDGKTLEAIMIDPDILNYWHYDSDKQLQIHTTTMKSSAHRVDINTIEQYTGLDDANGFRIYKTEFTDIFMQNRFDIYGEKLFIV